MRSSAPPGPAASTEIELGPLSNADVERLVGPRPDVIAAADGNPLLALEAARGRRRHACAVVVRDAIVRLPPDARGTAELAAVAGRDLDRAELAKLADPGSRPQRHRLRPLPQRRRPLRLPPRAPARSGLRGPRRRPPDGPPRDAWADARQRRRVRPPPPTRGPRRPRRRPAGPGGGRRHPRDGAAGGGRLPARGGRARPQAGHPDRAGRPRSPCSGTARRRSRPSRPHGPHTADDHLRAAQWFHSSLCDPTSAFHAAVRGLAAGGGDLDTRAELLLVRAWGEVAAIGVENAPPHAGRGRGARRRSRVRSAAAPARGQPARLHRARRGAAGGRRGGVGRLGRGG